MSDKQLQIDGITFDFLKDRLIRGSEVYKSVDHDPIVFLRVGGDETWKEEQRIRELTDRGYPVGEIVMSGTLDDERRYFGEKSLGDQHYGELFRPTFDGNRVDDELFTDFSQIMYAFLGAELNPANALSDDFDLLQIAEYDIFLRSYEGDYADEVRAALEKATQVLSPLPTVYIQNDLSPFNTMPGGVIDFEYVYPGPLAYDVLSAIHYASFVPDQSLDEGDRDLRKWYYFDENQRGQYYETVIKGAEEAGYELTEAMTQAYIMIRSIWSACKSTDALDDPNNRRRFWQWRFGIMKHCVDKFLNDELIDLDSLNDVGMSYLEEIEAS